MKSGLYYIEYCYHTDYGYEPIHGQEYVEVTEFGLTRLNENSNEDIHYNETLEEYLSYYDNHTYEKLK